MLKKICKQIEDRRASKAAFWIVLVFLKDAVWSSLDLYEKFSCYFYIKKSLCATKVKKFFDREASQNKSNRIYEYFTNLFKKELVPTEHSAYKLLKKNPIFNTNYLAVPWSALLNKNALKLIPKIHLNGGFTICQHIHYEKIIPILRKIGVNTLFTPHADKDYPGIRVLPFPHHPVNAPRPAEKKDILYSFLGAATHECRKEILRLPKRKAVFIGERKGWYFNKKLLAEKIEYQNILARSRFSLCPRGTGTSTIRFWESLQAGAIPILISDKMRLPGSSEFDWEECTIKIKESDVVKIDDVIKNIAPEKENKLRENCLRAGSLFSGENFVKCIRDYYKEDDKIKIYCYHTSSYKILTKKNLIPSTTEYQPVFKVEEDRGMISFFKDKKWPDVTAKKTEFIIQAVKENMGKVFIFTDPDVQFLNNTKEAILAALNGKDIVFQKDDPGGTACTGFFACVGTKKILNFWTEVRKMIGNGRDDQDCANKLLKEGCNNLKWGYLPDKFMGGGTLTGKNWYPGMHLPIPKDIVFHHANWTKGIKNKMKQLDYVKKSLLCKKK